MDLSEVLDDPELEIPQPIIPEPKGDGADIQIIFPEEDVPLQPTVEVDRPKFKTETVFNNDLTMSARDGQMFHWPRGTLLGILVVNDHEVEGRVEIHGNMADARTRLNDPLKTIDVGATARKPATLDGRGSDIWMPWIYPRAVALQDPESGPLKVRIGRIGV